MIVFHLACIMPISGKTFQASYILAINKPNSKIISINLTHGAMKTPQNVLKMSTVSHDTSRETVTPLTGDYNNN